MKFSSLKFIIICLIFSGCREEVRQIGKLEDFRPDETLAVINGEKYLKKDYDLEYALRMEMLKNRLERLPEQKVHQIKNAYRSGILSSFIENQLAESYFDRMGIRPTKETRNKIERQFVQVFKRRIGGDKSQDAYSRLVDSIDDPKLRCLFLKNVNHAACVEEYLMNLPSNGVNVTEVELDRLENRMRQEDEDALATNRVIYAQATNIWRQASQGADFAVLADRYSEEPEKKPGGIMGECDANDFAIDRDESGENPVWEVVGSLRTGEVSPPLSTADGLAVFKCTGRIAKSENTDRPAMLLSRIILHRALLYPPHTREELREAISKDRRQKVLRQFSDELHKDAQISFPHGMAFLPPKLRRAYETLSQSNTNQSVNVAGDRK